MHREGLSPGPDDVIAGICSAGDNVFDHLTGDVKHVYAVDINPVQITVARLKAEAIRTLSHTELAAFLGYTEASNDRIATYRSRVRPQLPEEEQTFWDHHLQWIENGVIHFGKFEGYFHHFQKYVLSLMHSRKTRHHLFREMSKAEREEFYRKKWDNQRWRLLFRIFFSKPVMARLGRSPAHFAHVENGDITKQFRMRARHAMVELDPSSNPFLQYMILGRFRGEKAWPEFLKKHNLKVIRERLDRLTFIHDSLDGFLNTMSDASISAWNLSDMFEYLDENAFADLTRLILRKSAPEARYSYWNLLVRRRMSDVAGDQLHYFKDISHQLWLKDRAFVYGDYICEQLPKEGKREL